MALYLPVLHTTTQLLQATGRRIAILLMICLRASSATAQEHPATLSSAGGGRSIVVMQDTASIQLLLRKADSLLRLADSNAAVLFATAYQYSRQVNYYTGIARALGGIGTNYIIHGRYDHSIPLLQQAIAAANKAGDRNVIAHLNSNLAVVYQRQGLYATAMLCFLKSLDALNYKEADPNRIAQLHINLSALWLRLGEQQQAFINLRIANNKINGDTGSSYYPNILFNIGTAYTVTNMDSALMYFKATLPYAYKRQDLVLEINVLDNIGSAYMAKQDSAHGMPYLRQSYALSRKVNLPEMIIAAEDALAEGYLDIKQYALAEPYLLDALNLANELHHYEFIANVNSHLAALYAATGRYRQAYEHQTIATALNDTIQKQEKGKTVDMLLQFRAAEKDKIIAQKQVELAQKEAQLKMKNIWLGIFIFGILLLTSLFLSLYRAHIHKRRLYAQRLLALNQDQEIGKLKADSAGEERERTRLARELHDGIMVQFSVVKMHLSILKDQHEVLHTSAFYLQAMQQLDVATKELRQIAHNLMPDMLLQEGLLPAISYFCKTIGSLKGLHISFQQYGDIRRYAPDFEIGLYRVLQELLHNIIKHAGAHKVLVQLNAHDQLLCLTVEDDGAGFDTTSTTAAHQGMGLRSLHSRIKELGGQLDISSTPGEGTTVYIEFGIIAYIDS